MICTENIRALYAQLPMKKERSPLPFDVLHFRKMADCGKRYSAAEAFEYIYRTNHWSGNDSVSGVGSDLTQTAEIRRALVSLLSEFGIRVLLDLPCGDFGWMSTLALPVDSYVGGDIVRDLIEENRKRYENSKRTFMELDIITGPLPEADLLICRDCFVHFSFDDIRKSLATIRAGRIRYLLATTFSQCDRNVDIVTGDWRILNLEIPPFNFPRPTRLINEKCTEGGGTYSDKSMGLWDVAALPR